MAGPTKREDYDFLYKIILVGDPKVGKTSLLTRYTKNVVKNPNPTIGVEYATKCVLLKNGAGIVKAQIWDTSGSEKYKSITTAHYRRSVGALLFYDLTEEQSFRNTEEWLKEIQEHTEEGIVILLIGNKYDLVEENPSERKVKIEEVQNFCKKNYLLYNETSAKTGFNVKESFEMLIESIHLESTKRTKNVDEYENKIVLQSNPPSNQGAASTNNKAPGNQEKPSQPGTGQGQPGSQCCN